MPRPAAADSGLTAAEFRRLLAPLLAPEPPAAIAVACSGGPDSLCLALLAHDWAQARGLVATALIVDHGLRPESTAEARQVRGWLRAAGMPVHILTWHGAKPVANRQAAARQARYRLLAGWCRRRDVRHLLLAQHRDDQAETLLLRAARGSGVDGLAAMAPLRAEADGLLLLRPLLAVPKSRLLASLRQRGQPWLEDPSNRSPAYARSGARTALSLLGPDAGAHLALTARNMARARQALEQIAAERLAASVAFEPAAGLAWIAPESLLAGPDEIALRALDRLLRRIGGLALPPRLDRLERLLAALRAGDWMQTLQRCRLLPWQGKLLAVREARHLPAPVALSAGLDGFVWDGRYHFQPGPGLPRRLVLRALGDAEPPPDQAEWLAAWPRPAWAGLPLLCRNDRPWLLPSLVPAASSPLKGLICNAFTQKVSLTAK